jgi:tetratricopeptide (TPR) repeat protein
VNPYDFTANTEIALLLLQDGKPDEALSHNAMALQVRPTDPGALYQRASIHMEQGLTGQARQELEQLIRDYPNFSEAHAALARVYYKLQRTADGDREAAEARRVREEAQKLLEEKRKPARPRSSKRDSKTAWPRPHAARIRSALSVCNLRDLRLSFFPRVLRDQSESGRPARCERLVNAAGPDYVDLLHHLRLTQTEVHARIARAGVTGAGSGVIVLHARIGGHAHLRP